MGSELVRFGIMVDGEDNHKMTNLKAKGAKFIEQKLIELVNTAKKLANNLPKRINDEIISGRFTAKIQRYK